MCDREAEELAVCEAVGTAEAAWDRLNEADWLEESEAGGSASWARRRRRAAGRAAALEAVTASQVPRRPCPVARPVSPVGHVLTVHWLPPCTERRRRGAMNSVDARIPSPMGTHRLEGQDAPHAEGAGRRDDQRPGGELRVARVVGGGAVAAVAHDGARVRGCGGGEVYPGGVPHMQLCVPKGAFH